MSDWKCDANLYRRSIPDCCGTKTTVVPASSARCHKTIDR